MANGQSMAGMKTLSKWQICKSNDLWLSQWTGKIWRFNQVFTCPAPTRQKTPLCKDVFADFQICCGRPLDRNLFCREAYKNKYKCSKDKTHKDFIKFRDYQNLKVIWLNLQLSSILSNPNILCMFGTMAKFTFRAWWWNLGELKIC